MIKQIFLVLLALSIPVALIMGFLSILILETVDTAGEIEKVCVPVWVNLNTEKYQILEKKRLPALKLKSGDSLPVKQIFYRLKGELSTTHD